MRIVRGCDPIASRMPNSRVRPLTENASTPGDADDRDRQRDRREAAEDDRVQPIGREHLGADVVERRRALHRLIGRQLADRPGDRRHQRVRIARACARTAVRRRAPARTGGRPSSPACGSMRSSSMSAATPTIRRGSVLMPMNFIRPSVHIRWRFSGSWPGNSCCAMLALTMTTRSAPSRSASVKSRPASIGMPSAAKNPGDTDRGSARADRPRRSRACALRPRTGSRRRNRRRRATARCCRTRRARRPARR